MMPAVFRYRSCPHKAVDAHVEIPGSRVCPMGKTVHRQQQRRRASRHRLGRIAGHPQNFYFPFAARISMVEPGTAQHAPPARRFHTECRSSAHRWVSLMNTQMASYPLEKITVCAALDVQGDLVPIIRRQRLKPDLVVGFVRKIKFSCTHSLSLYVLEYSQSLAMVSDFPPSAPQVFVHLLPVQLVQNLVPVTGYSFTSTWVTPWARKLSAAASTPCRSCPPGPQSGGNSTGRSLFASAAGVPLFSHNIPYKIVIAVQREIKGTSSARCGTCPPPPHPG